MQWTTKHRPRSKCKGAKNDSDKKPSTGCVIQSGLVQE